MDARKDRLGEHAAGHALPWAAWAPPWAGDELRQVRGAGLAAARADADAGAAGRSGDQQAAARHRVLAASYRAMGEAYRDRERMFAGVMADRAGWDAATRAQRHLAVAADAELRRRHPAQRFTPLRSVEPPAVTDARRAELTLTAGPDIPDAGPWIKDLDAGRRRFATRLADRQSLMIPAEDPGYGDIGRALPRLDRILPQCDPAAAETTDPPLSPRPRARRGPRGRRRSRGMTVAGASWTRRADRDCCADDDGRLEIAASAAAAAGSHNHRDQVTAGYLDGH
jgi:hypothetical protein